AENLESAASGLLLKGPKGVQNHPGRGRRAAWRILTLDCWRGSTVSSRLPRHALVDREACPLGDRTNRNLITMAYLIAGQLKFNLPT
ncbi:MAG: hypothetical protein MUO58_05820, partial [Anaerolineales bacterium]|nr:hypothetical protein [Anaerolineales bacterium]